MSTKHNLLAGTSLFALVLGATGTAHAQGFVFGISGASVDASTSSSSGLTDESTSALSSQVNNNLSLSAQVEGNVAGSGGSVTGGPSLNNGNVMSATAIANQFSMANGGAYVVDPSYASPGGTVNLGLSQLNSDSLAANSTGRLGIAGTETGGVSNLDGTGNAINFTADATSDAPVSVSGNSFNARVNGNLQLSTIAGSVPMGGLASGTASLTTDTVAGATPAGASIIVLAPISLSGVQQNIVDSGAATTLDASMVNTVVSALFRDATQGVNGGSIAISNNSLTAVSAANNATSSIDLNAAIIPQLGGGVALITAQGNGIGTTPGSTLTVQALNNAAALRIQSQDAGTEALTQIGNATATLSGNTISARATLNESNAQTLSTSATLAAGGTQAASPPTQSISPNGSLTIGSATTGSINAQSDYLNIANQTNIGVSGATTITATAGVGDALIGFFGGVSSGTVTIQSNAVGASAQGNVASLSTVMPLLSGSAGTLTAVTQLNDGVQLGAATTGTQIRISDSSALMFGTDQNIDIASVAPGVVDAAAGGGSTITNSVLSIGSAASAALGNTVRATAFGNNATATANLGVTGGTAATAALSMGVTGVIAALPTGTTIEADAANSVIIAQTNLGLTATAGIASPTVTLGTAGGNGLFQIDALQGLTSSTATIGYNAARATAVGNFAEATASMSAASGNQLPGNVAVGTFQGNADGILGAYLGGTGDSAAGTRSGAVASIGAGVLTNSTAQVVNNTFAAVAVANSATGALNIASGTIAGGTSAPSGYTGTAADMGSLSGNYVVGNAQTNSGTRVIASTLDQTTLLTGISADATFDSAGTMTFPLTTVLGQLASAGGFTSVLNVGATSFTGSNGLVTGNTVSTTGVGNEFSGQLAGFVTPSGTSGTSYTSGSVSSTQRNIADTSGNTNSTVTSVNAGNGFVVSTASSAADATQGVSGDLGGDAASSVLSVSNNTASAVATANSASLGVTGIANSDGGASSAGASISAIAGAVSNMAPVTVTNVQSNTYASSPAATAAVLAATVSQSFSVNVGSTSDTTDSTLQVNANAMTATATANTATLSASLATGPAYTGAIGLLNRQENTGAGAGNASNTTSIGAIAGYASFTAGTGTGAGATSSPVEGSTIAVSNNRMVATATQNTASLSVTAASTALIQGGYAPSILEADISSGTVTGQADGSVVAANSQSVTGMSSYANALFGAFTATATASNSTVAVDSNTVSSVARGNTAEATLTLPRIDGTARSINTQIASGSTISALTDTITMSALSNAAGGETEGSSVSASSNLVTASSTVNAFAATLSGLAQSAPTTPTQLTGELIGSASQLAVTSPLSGQPLLALVSAQQVEGTTNSALTSAISIGIALNNDETSSSMLAVNANTVSATANGNVTAQNILANGMGSADSQGAIGNFAAQGFGVGAGTPSVTSALVNGATLSVATGLAPLASSAGTMSDAAIAVNGNTVNATATANSATLNTAFTGALRSAGSGGGSVLSETSAGTLAATADYALASIQRMGGDSTNATLTSNTRAMAEVRDVSLRVLLTNASTENGTISLSNNNVAATATGNLANLSMTSNVAGSTAPGGVGIASSQAMDYSLVSATNTRTTIGAQANGAVPMAGVLTNTPVTISGNMIGASASGNSASLNSNFASAGRMSGLGTLGSGSITGTTGATAMGDYALLNTQRMNGSAVSASVVDANVRYAGASMGGPVNIQGNTIFATAFGNSASMAMAGAQAGGSMQATNLQSTNNSVISASISGTNLSAGTFAGPAGTGPMQSSGNTLRAVAVGNSVTQSVGR